MTPDGRSELGIHFIYHPTPTAPELHDIHRALGDLELVYADSARKAGFEFAARPLSPSEYGPYLPEEMWLVWGGAWWVDEEVLPGLTVREIKLRSPLELITEIPTWVMGAGGVGIFLGSLKRVWNLDVEWRADRWTKKADAEEARLRYERASRARADQVDEAVDPNIARRVRRSRMRPRQMTVFDPEERDE